MDVLFLFLPFCVPVVTPTGKLAHNYKTEPSHKRPFLRQMSNKSASSEKPHMDISLKSRADIVSWASVFRILGYEPCMPIWGILDLPKEIINNPKAVLDIAKIFFNGIKSIWTPQQMTSDEEVANHMEAQRMIDLGLLYDCFGRIVKSYGEEAAIKLYEWGERQFIHEKSTFWWVWWSIFSKQLRNQTSVISFTAPNNYQQILSIIKDQVEQESLREKRLDIEFEKLCQNFSANPEEINRLNNASVSDITIFNNFDDVTDELSNIFDFESILTRDCAYKVWQRINANFEKEVRENIFQWGVKESKNIGSRIDRKLKNYCLSI
ncbi:MAG TPA: hypothetical protein VK400_14320 [Pyrinomonadaceae bacterium]|nr:hypothetical protein [Pyrinomonadaceae bacterium]